MASNLTINPKTEVAKITNFIRRVLKEQKHERVILAVSGGIDSTSCLYLLQKAIPTKNITALHLPYFANTKLPKMPIDVEEISIRKAVDSLLSELNVPQNDHMRIGNIMARVRMVMLYDLGKKNNALVCGTENKSEYYLGYFTRFGDEASDFEPIRHLYKTQVYQLAKYLGVSQEIISKSPTAGLWQGQTDEGEFGFTYEEADQVLHLYFDKRLSIEEIEKKGLENAKKILERVKKNEYKHHTPFAIEATMKSGQEK